MDRRNVGLGDAVRRVLVADVHEGHAVVVLAARHLARAQVVDRLRAAIGAGLGHAVARVVVDLVDLEALDGSLPLLDVLVHRRVARRRRRVGSVGRQAAGAAVARAPVAQLAPVASLLLPHRRLVRIADHLAHGRTLAERPMLVDVAARHHARVVALGAAGAVFVPRALLVPVGEAVGGEGGAAGGGGGADVDGDVRRAEGLARRARVEGGVVRRKPRELDVLGDQRDRGQRLLGRLGLRGA